MSTFFNGVRLEDYYVVSDVSRPVPGMSVETVDVPGRDGVLVGSTRHKEGSVSFLLWPHWVSKEGLRAAVRDIAALLHTDRPVPLQFGDDGGLYYMAIQSGELDVKEFSDAFAVSCKFLVPEAAMYGAERSVTVPSGGSAELLVGGSYPASPVIVADAAVRGASDLWGVRLDDGDYSRVKIPTASPTAVTIDARGEDLGGQAVKVAGTTALMTLGSDWLELEPGHHVIENDVGTGGCVVSWVERWY